MGAYNFSAPEPVRYNDFSAALGRALGRPAVFRTPAFAIRLAAGELGDVLLGSQRAVPRRLLAEGFEFHFKTIDSALADLTGPERSEANSDPDR
jgi:NAD dependent epimerase/dehydratase family enzyme